MNVLVTAASRHGSTAEIAERVAAGLRLRGHTTVVLPPEQVRSLDGFGAVVLGSAVYIGGWLKPARAFAGRFVGDLTARSVWLFSSGPVSAPPISWQSPKGIDALVSRTGARDHQLFAGRLDPSQLSIAERVAVRAASVDAGDYRDWAAIDAWTTAITAAIAADAAIPGRGDDIPSPPSSRPPIPHQPRRTP